MACHPILVSLQNLIRETAQSHLLPMIFETEVAFPVESRECFQI